MKCNRVSMWVTRRLLDRLEVNRISMKVVSHLFHVCRLDKFCHCQQVLSSP